MRSDGFDIWNAPAAIKRMWSVFTGPCFVVTVVPSTTGRRSLCTPSLDTSGPWLEPLLAILSISSINIIPVCWVLSIASLVTLSMSMSLFASSCTSSLKASGTFIFFLLAFSGIKPPSISFRFISSSSMPTFEITPKGMTFSLTSTSTYLLSSFPSLSCDLSLSLVSLCFSFSSSSMLTPRPLSSASRPGRPAADL